MTQTETSLKIVLDVDVRQGVYLSVPIAGFEFAEVNSCLLNSLEKK